jgi:putative Mn2+ efflux pump MntP
MPASGKVSLTRQTIYVFIPILDLYAAYHIKRLRWYLGVMILVSLGLSALSSVAVPSGQEYDEKKIATIDGQLNWGYLILGENPGIAISMIILHQSVSFAVAVYLIRKWSRAWNKQFETIM